MGRLHPFSLQNVDDSIFVKEHVINNVRWENFVCLPLITKVECKKMRENINLNIFNYFSQNRKSLMSLAGELNRVFSVLKSGGC